MPVLFFSFFLFFSGTRPITSLRMLEAPARYGKLAASPRKI